LWECRTNDITEYCEYNAEILNVRAGGAYLYHCASEGYKVLSIHSTRNCVKESTIPFYCN